MKKLVPWIRLAVFCLAIFAVTVLGMLLKDDRLFMKGGGAGDPAGAGAGGPEQHASLAGAAGGSGGTGGSDPNAGSAQAVKPAEGTEAHEREKALASGRALFDLPEPFSIVEASELMSDLKRQKQDQDARTASLDQRERELERMEQEIESRRLQVLALAGQVESASAPIAAAAAEALDDFDPEAVKRVAGILETMTPDVAAKALANYPPDRAARLLLDMKPDKAGPVLAFFEDEKLTRITDELLRVKRPGSR